MKAKKKVKLDLINEDTLVGGVDVGKRKHYARFITIFLLNIYKLYVRIQKSLKKILESYIMIK